MQTLCFRHVLILPRPVAVNNTSFMNLFVMENVQAFTFHQHIHRSEVHYMYTDTHKHSHLYCSPFSFYFIVLFRKFRGRVYDKM